MSKGKLLRKFFSGDIKGKLFEHEDGYSIYLEILFSNSNNERTIKYLKVFPEEIKDFKKVIDNLFKNLKFV